MVRFDYGLILIENLKQTNAFLNAKAIAQAHKLSPSLMEKVAQDFRRIGWIQSRRGYGGGYKILKNNISVADVINFYTHPFKICPITRIQK